MLLKQYIKQQNSQININQSSPKNNKKAKFIPFVNQRDGVGNILESKNRTKQPFNPQQIFQNLKKSTRQYYFDKMYSKLMKRHQQSKLQLKQRNLNIDKQISGCFQSLSKQQKRSRKQKSLFYLQLRQKMNQHVQALKQQIHGSNLKQSLVIKRVASHHCLKRKQIKEQIFSKSPKSKFMATFTNCGNKYRQLVQQKKFDPLSKWYIKKQMQIFPGKTVSGKFLQKNLYDCI